MVRYLARDHKLLEQINQSKIALSISGKFAFTQTFVFGLLFLISQVEAKSGGGGFFLFIFTDENGSVSGWRLALLILSILLTFSCCCCYCYGKSRGRDDIYATPSNMPQNAMEQRRNEIEIRNNYSVSNQPVHYLPNQDVAISMPKGITLLPYCLSNVFIFQ